MNRAITLVLITLTLAPFAGCISLFGGDSAPAETVDAETEFREKVGKQTADKIAARIAPVPKTYSFPDQKVVAWKTVTLEGVIDATSSALGYEDRNDRGGNNYNTPRIVFDVSGDIPVGQPTEMFVQLVYSAQPGSTADLDLYVNLPGHKTDVDTSNSDEFNWKFTVERGVFNTVGVAGAPHEVGVQISNGRSLPTDPLPFTIQIEYSYAKDVLTPGVPYAFNVPKNATGVVLESVKAGGSDHVRSRFVIIDPNDQLVQYLEFDDISIPTESVFIPTSSGPGEYIFYAFDMHGGFLSLQSDAGLEERTVRALSLVTEDTIDAAGPSPGIIGHDWFAGDNEGAPEGVLVTPRTGGESVGFTVDGPFPLNIIPWLRDASGTVMAEIRISSASGVVAEYERAFRYDDERGSLGYSSEKYNTYFSPAALAKGAYTVEIVNDSNGQLGHTVVTYKR